MKNKNLIPILIIFLVSVSFSCKENQYDANESSTTVEEVTFEVPIADSEIIDTMSFEKEKMPERDLTFEEALVTSSISDLKKFIENNPNHSKSDLLDKRLIDLEVDAIYYDKGTSEMPKADLVQNTNASTSNISITNDTSCELIVRYSGSDSKMMRIPSQRTKSISIESGSYRITASACGYNYYGSESLSGEYTSSYYIKTSYN
jgi:hypothetical protein